MIKEDELSIIDRMPQIKIPNKFFLNQGDLTFMDAESLVAANVPSYSNGAAYADLDNDGDLDVVVNNLDAAPFIYKNVTQLDSADKNSFLAFQFEGGPANRDAIGAKIVLRKGDTHLVYEHFPVRGYQSSVAPGIHIGVGDPASVDEAWCIWPDRSFHVLENLSFNESTTPQMAGGTSPV